MRGFFLKLNYEKGLLGKEKKRIKKYKTGKIHKFYYAFYHPSFKKKKYKAVYRKPNPGLFFWLSCW